MGRGRKIKAQNTGKVGENSGESPEDMGEFIFKILEKVPTVVKMGEILRVDGNILGAKENVITGFAIARVSLNVLNVDDGGDGIRRKERSGVEKPLK
ncbi:unnamed protein product [Allacma fusca]|uniref:Uncharacterized protein n=1 Tax=Allacma fusca TaxID=39272 RepID=A0A8J2P2T4_9HEXA|nr:unnamed protein product [Allacma fusca]